MQKINHMFCNYVHFYIKLMEDDVLKTNDD